MDFDWQAALRTKRCKFSRCTYWLDPSKFRVGRVETEAFEVRRHVATRFGTEVPCPCHI